MREGETVSFCSNAPASPSSGFRDLAQAQAWVLKFVRWYNLEHCHSAIRFVTPEQRHSGADVEILRQREALYERTKQERSERWSGKTRNWSRPEVMLLNPDKIDVMVNEKLAATL